MISVKEACKIAIAHNPNNYVFCVTEFDKVYAIVMLGKGETLNEHTFLGFEIPTVNKESGEYTDETPLYSPLFDSDFVKYLFSEGDDLDNIDINERIVQRGHA